MGTIPDYIVVGRFGRPYGLVGEIYITPISDNPERFRKRKGKFWMEADDGWVEISLSFRKEISGRPLVKIAGVNRPEDAQKYNNELIYIRATSLEKLPEGRYYHFDLVDCRVTDEKGAELGKVTAVEEYPANDVLVIKTKTGKEHLFPMIKRYLKTIDLEKKLIVIEPPDGIF